jgi:hypothetical protein
MPLVGRVAAVSVVPRRDARCCTPFCEWSVLYTRVTHECKLVLSPQLAARQATWCEAKWPGQHRRVLMNAKAIR